MQFIHQTVPSFSYSFLYSKFLRISGIRARFRPWTLGAKQMQNSTTMSTKSWHDMKPVLNAALQAVLTKLQALRAFCSQNTSPPETNPFARDKSSHPHTSHFNTINDHPHQHLKFSFPNFNRDDPTEGFTRQNNTLISRTLHQTNKFSWPPSI